jgi:hypothetical protein
MPTPKAGYFLNGERIPGVTTILGRFKNAGPLMHWAWECGVSGKDYRQVRDEAASIGTVAHAMVESYIHGEEFDLAAVPSEIITPAQRSFSAFLEWAESHKFQVTDVEIQMISPTYRYGGTIDGCLISSKRVIFDVKTSNAVYPEMLCQLAAYRYLWNELHPSDQCEPGGHLVRFDKTTGDFRHLWFSELDDAWLAFVHMRDLYSLMKVLEKRVK